MKQTASCLDYRMPVIISIDEPEQMSIPSIGIKCSNPLFVGLLYIVSRTLVYLVTFSPSACVESKRKSRMTATAYGRIHQVFFRLLFSCNTLTHTAFERRNDYIEKLSTNCLRLSCFVNKRAHARGWILKWYCAEWYGMYVPAELNQQSQCCILQEVKIDLGFTRLMHMTREYMNACAMV